MQFPKTLKIKIMFIISFLTLMIWFGGLNPCQAEPSQQVFFVLTDQVRINDFLEPEFEFMRELITQNAVALINTNTAAGTGSAPHTYATVSAGRVAAGETADILGMNATEKYNGIPASEIFKRYTGLEADPQNVLELNWPQILNNNLRLKTRNMPGVLGENLKQAGIAAAAVGNSDIPGRYNRPAAIIAMDARGVVHIGNVTQDLLKSSSGFLERRTDFERLFNEIKQVREKADFIVIDLGDLNRLGAQKHLGLDLIIAEERKAILKEIDAFLKRLVETIDRKNSLLIIAALTPSSQAVSQKEYLTPVIMVSDKIGKGVLTSNTTRRRGIITNTDLTATILSCFGLKVPAVITGTPASAVYQSDSLNYLIHLKDRVVFTYKIRPGVIKTYVTLQIVTIITSLVLIFSTSKIIKWFKFWLAALMVFPLTLLISGGFTYSGITAYVIEIVILTIGLVAAAWKFNQKELGGLFLNISILTFSAIILDLIMDSFLMKHSVLGYDPIAGARFYGIGNEYMGVLIGSFIMGMAFLYQRLKSPKIVEVFVVLSILIVFLMINSQFGANFGGTIASIAAFGFLISRWKLNLGWRTLGFLAIMGSLLFIVSMTGWGLKAQTQSHLGRTVVLIKEQGAAEVADIINRKISMNLKLIRYTYWSKVFLVALAALGIIFNKPVGLFQRIRQKHTKIYEGFLGVLTGSFAALAANDSGIVAAATTMIYGVYPLIALAFEEHQKLSN